MAPQPDSAKRRVAASRILAEELAAFSARAGHDLVGPLNQASSLLALFIHQRKGNPDSEANALLDYLQGSASKMQVVLAAVQQYLNVAADTDAFDAVDLNAVLAALRQKMERQIAATGAVISHEPLPIITANGGQMTTLFENLLGNSIRFRRPEESPLIRISARDCGDEWLFAVADNGIGIDEEFREVVFQPFRRLHGREYPGAGVGLTTARLIARLHGGDIRIEAASESGNAPGAVVLFTLPR